MDSQASGQVEKKSVQVDQKLNSETRKVPSGGSFSGQTNDTVSLSQRGQAAVSQEVKDVKGGSVESKLRKVDVMDNNQVVIKIVDSETQKVVRQIPKEEEVRLKQAMQENLENMADSSGTNQNLDIEI
jgi:uncharacterized FlaG/YvyC family protein|tara:strand:- start:5700 stop:6083 length:384 start_codon:yes stop_codon:yes gene_type:complete